MRGIVLIGKNCNFEEDPAGNKVFINYNSVTLVRLNITKKRCKFAPFDGVWPINFVF